MFFSAAASAARARFPTKVVSAAGRCSGGTCAGQHVDLPSADRHHIVERLPEQRGEFRLAPRHRGKTGTAPAA